MEQPYTMQEVRSFTTLLTIGDDGVNVGDIKGSDQRIAKRMEMRYDFGVV
jgi:hypothetical protein